MSAMTDIDTLACKLQADVNAEIKAACQGESRLRWQTLAERIASERLSGDWEWVTECFFGGQPPCIAITRYLR